MSILIDEKTQVIVQGITGNEGSRACKEMLNYGTKVVAGVTPGKGGQNVEGVPVYNSVKEALDNHSGVTASLIVVPAQFVKDAALEAIDSGIKIVDILTEYVSARDTSVIYAKAKLSGVMVIGPSSVGIISPGKSKIGAIGSGEMSDVFTSGNIGLISKSGGMTAEIALAMTNGGFGQSTAVGIGGDIIACSDYIDLIKLFEDDSDTDAVVIMGEVGGIYEEDLADYVKSEKVSKPIIALVGGKFSDKLPSGVVLGHAGSIVSRGKGSYESKTNALKKAGIRVVATVEEIPVVLKEILEKWKNGKHQ